MLACEVTKCHYTEKFIRAKIGRMNDLYRSQFRLPWALYEALQTQATENGISLNAELVQRLQASLSPQPNIDDIRQELSRQSQQIDLLRESINRLLISIEKS
ncbi:Arc family DNA-binding protein [Deefgea rivuli]|uniref:Arc family DNA-binding protein n=1 Tax=Deefgea rivuli TaxID=400948 RepID=UPI00055B2DA9|nr:Arc family DNA-binding protein [Deefgea rivuli]